MPEVFDASLDTRRPSPMDADGHGSVGDRVDRCLELCAPPVRMSCVVTQLSCPPAWAAPETVSHSKRHVTNLKA